MPSVHIPANVDLGDAARQNRAERALRFLEALHIYICDEDEDPDAADTCDALYKGLGLLGMPVP